MIIFLTVDELLAEDNWNNYNVHIFLGRREVDSKHLTKTLVNFFRAFLKCYNCLNRQLKEHIDCRIRP